MSYDIRLVDPATRETVTLEERHNLIGGTYQMGGTREAWLNVTYNYGKFYYETIDREKGIRSLYGKTGREAIPILRAAIEKLGTQRWTGSHFTVTWPLPDNMRHWYARLKGVDLDVKENVELLREARAAGVVEDGGAYWKPTPGNAGAALADLLRLAEMVPDAVFDGD